MYDRNGRYVFDKRLYYDTCLDTCESLDGWAETIDGKPVTGSFYEGLRVGEYSVSPGWCRKVSQEEYDRLMDLEYDILRIWA